ncbi:transposase family protein [Streptomyces gelaticus]
MAGGSGGGSGSEGGPGAWAGSFGVRVADGVSAFVTGFKATRARKLTTSEKEANQALAAARAPVEHGFAHLKNWRILTKLRTDPARATGLLRALFVLTNLEGAR